MLNRYNKRANSNLASREQIESTLNQKIFFGIPENYATALGAVNKGRPVVADPSTKSSDLTTALQAFVTKSMSTANAEAVKVGVK